MKLHKIKWHEMSIAKLLQIVFSLTLIAVLSIVVFMYYGFTSNLLNDNIKMSLRDFAISAQYIIDGDRHESITSAESQDFNEMCKQLAQYKKDVGVYDVYTIVKNNENSTKLFLAAYDAKSTFMVDYIISDEIIRAFNGEVVTTKNPYTDGYGTFYSGYAPLYNSEHEIVAVVAIDLRADSVKALKDDIVKRALLIFLVCFILGNLVVFGISHAIGTGFKRIIHQLTQIGEGDLTASVGNEFPMFTEIRELETTINEMAKNISDLVSLIIQSSNELKTNASHFLDAIVITETSSQFMASTVDEMMRIHTNVSNLFDNGLTQLLHYKEDSDKSIMEYRIILESIESTKDLLESILLEIKDFKIENKSVDAFDEKCQMLYLEYDNFNNSIRHQLEILDTIGERRSTLIQINQQVSKEFIMITDGNQLISESMSKQVEVIQTAVKDVEKLLELAEELNERINNLKTL